MTQARRDTHSTEFGLWLREQKEIDSALGFVASNIDYMWSNYKTGDWMLVEEKRHGQEPKYYQQQLFNKLDNAGKSDRHYKGFHLVVFENTSPSDGRIWLDKKEISKEQLIKFLRFENYNTSALSARDVKLF